MTLEDDVLWTYWQERALKAEKIKADLLAALENLCEAIYPGAKHPPKDKTLDIVADSCGGNIADKFQDALAAIAKAKGE